MSGGRWIGLAALECERDGALDAAALFKVKPLSGPRTGEVVFEDGEIVFVGHGFAGEVARRIDYGHALIGPGFVDCDALSDLDTTILGYDNQPAWKKGRVWPHTYMEAGPYEMYSADELVFQKRHAFAGLLRNGITTALPIASLFYREWGETVAEFEGAAAAAAELGLRVYLGPAYRTGNTFVSPEGSIEAFFDADGAIVGEGQVPGGTEVLSEVFLRNDEAVVAADDAGIDLALDLIEDGELEQ